MSELSFEPYPCPKCGMLIECGIFNAVAHEEKYHDLAKFVGGLTKELQTRGTFNGISRSEAEEIVDKVLNEIRPKE